MPRKLAVRVTRAELDLWYVQQGLTLRAIAAKFGCSMSPVARRMKHLGLARRPAGRLPVPVSRAELIYLYNDLGLDTHAIARRYHCTKTHILRKMKDYGLARRPPVTVPQHPRSEFSGDTVEKAYLLGFRAGDLNVRIRTERNSRTIEAGCGTTHPEQIDLVRRLFERYGRVYEHRPKHSPHMHVVAYLNQSFGFLLNKPWRLPAWARRNDTCFWAFFAGYTDAEGSIGVYQGRARFVIGSYDVGILRDLWTGLVARGISCPPVRLDQPRGSPTRSMHGTVHYTRGDRYVLFVSRVASLSALLTGLAPHLQHAKRRADMAAAWARVRSTAKRT